MRYSIHILVLITLLIVSGCSSIPADQFITLPETTPFDSNAMMRQVYLDGYRDGYRSVAHGGSGSIDSIRGPFQQAKELGWRTGAADAQRNKSKTP